MHTTSLIRFSALTGILMSLCNAATTLNIDNVDSLNPDALFLTTSSGVPLASGFMSIYDFSSGAPSSASELQLNGAIGMLGLSSLISTNLFQSEPGLMTVSFSLDSFSDKDNLFVAIGNGSSVADSSELALVQLGGLTLEGTPDPNLTDLGTYGLSNTRNSDVAVGTVGSGTFTLSASILDGFNPYSTSTLALVAVVPEPSSALLLGIGLVAAGARRRR